MRVALCIPDLEGVNTLWTVERDFDRAPRQFDGNLGGDSFKWLWIGELDGVPIYLCERALSNEVKDRIS